MNASSLAANTARDAIPPTSTNDLGQQLDAIMAQANGTDGIMDAWSRLFHLAGAVQAAQPAGDTAWRDVIRRHPIAQLAWQDPITAWSYQRPRGYPGDAHLIDFIYGHPGAEDDLAAATPAGRDVHAFIYGADSCVAVRERRRLLARLIDEAVERTATPEILAVACGHLREVELSRQIAMVERLVALDQDPASLAQLTASYPRLAPMIETVESPVGRFALRPTAHGRFDLIYAAGLYDYLTDRTAARLTAGLFSALKPGGRLLFANFATGIRDQGYMDALMDWRLILRDEAELQALVASLPRDLVRRARVFRGNNGVVLYALVVRA